MHRTFADFVAADVAIACKEYLDEHAAEVFRFSGDPLVLVEDGAAPPPLLASPVLEQIEVPGGGSRQGLREGLALLTLRHEPVIVYGRWEESPPIHYRVTVLATDPKHAADTLTDLAAFAETRRTITSPLFTRVCESLNSRVRQHFGDGATPSVLTHSFAEYQIANVSIQLKDFLDGLGAAFTNVGAGHRLGIRGFGDPPDAMSLLHPATIDRMGHFEGYDQAAPVFEQLAVDAETSRLGVREALALFHFEGHPMMVLCGRPGMRAERYQLTIASPDVACTRRLLERFLEHERTHSIFRGRLIRPQIDYSDHVKQAEILPFTDLGWDQVVLPDTLRHRIERDIIGYIHAADDLAANGVEARRSVIFHGPPGTGKTFMCKLLATELKGFTSILITGENLRRPEGAFALAQSLAPAILFFEDIDLVASDRETNPFPMVLGGLLNELDGLSQHDRIYVVFTTNRLEVLEEALAQRPGRVDLIASFPLPEAALRHRLIRLYAGKASVGDADVSWLAERTEGATPAFLCGLMKEAVFTAIRAHAVDAAGVAQLDRVHLCGALDRFEEIRREHGADRILGFRG